LGFLQDLIGRWEGEGFNLIARPDFQEQANLYLQLNQTHETLTFDPIGSAIPNRGFGQADIELFGLTYLQKITDQYTGGALHIEPGLWVKQPATTYPPEDPPEGAEIVARMGSIPHGNALLAQGIAEHFSGPPTLETAEAKYAFSRFPSFNSCPFFAEPAPPLPPLINAAGTAEKVAARELGSFDQYDLTVPASATNPRTPFGTHPPDPDLPEFIGRVPMQDVLNDPIRLLHPVIEELMLGGHMFEGVVLNIATQSRLSFQSEPNVALGSPPPDWTVVELPMGAGEIANMPFLVGTDKGPNAETATVYATFWLERITHPTQPEFTQLQYAQMTVLNFPILNTDRNLGWPHVSVATLRKPFS
jgi:hypothetical protein